MTSAVPHLSKNGWITSPTNVMTKQFEYFLTSDYSQTNLYRGEIASLKYILANNNAFADIKDAIRSALSNMYSRYFDKVTINITDNEEIISTTSTYNIYIDLLLVKDGVNYTLSQSVETKGVNILNMSNLIAELRGHN